MYGKYSYVVWLDGILARWSLLVAGGLGLSAVAFMVLYIWSVNNTIASTLAVKAVEKQEAAIVNDTARLEIETLRQGAGGSLEDRARELGLTIFGPPRFLTKEAIVARVGL